VREMSIDENYERNITPIRSEISRFREAQWDLQFTCIEREDERTLHGWIAALLLWTELEVIAKRGDRT